MRPDPLFHALTPFFESRRPGSRGVGYADAEESAAALRFARYAAESVTFWRDFFNRRRYNASDG